MTEVQAKSLEPFYILSLDGGGSLGVYTLGVLKEVESLVGEPLCNKFNLIYGTSTGSIIGSLLALDKSISQISKIYSDFIPDIMRPSNNSDKRSTKLKKCAEEIFKSDEFNQEKNRRIKTMLGVVATHYESRRPMIFKSSREMYRRGTEVPLGVPGFGCTIADAVVASCSASPLFNRHRLSTGEEKVVGIELIDGGFVASNPTLFAIVDAVGSLNMPERTIKVLNVGVGSYPRSSTSWQEAILRRIASSPLELFETTLAVTNNTLENLRRILYRNVSVVRISDSETRAKYSTNLLEFKPDKLGKIQRLGYDSYLNHKNEIEQFFCL